MALLDSTASLSDMDSRRDDVKDPRLDLDPAGIPAALSAEEKTLLTVRDELYEASWDRMEQDLRNRLTGKPYIFKLVNRIETDLAAIRFLRAYEERHRADLGRLVKGG